MASINKHRLIFALPLFLLMVAANPSYSQSLKAQEKTALRNFSNGNYVRAKNTFKVLYDSSYNQNSTSLYLAQCYFELHQPQKSYEVLKSVTNPSLDHLFLLILSAYNIERFQEARKLIAEFPETEEFDLSELKEKVDKALKSYDQQKGFLVQNFGPDINTENWEYSAVMLNGFNKLLYTSREESSSNTAEDGLAYESIFETEIDSMDNWKKPEKLRLARQDNNAHNATVQIYQSGKKMISYRNGSLYISVYENGTWTKNEDLDIHSQPGSDTHCFMTDDEQTLFFASDFMSDGDDLDLFVTYRDAGGKWKEPIPLNVFNTPYDEDSPFLATDSTFYFSSRGHNSIGGYDIYKSTYDPALGSWSKPENMGYPINTVAEDTYYTTNGKLAYLSSTRKGGYGSLDLYRVFLFNKVKVEGILLDKDQNPMTNAIIHVNYDSTTLNSYTDNKGYYEMYVPINKEMHIKFVKDSLNQFEGDYIANIFMKDENDNEFNFFIDYLNSDDQDLGSQVVKHINVDIKNDYQDNPVIKSTAPKMERIWADSLNTVTKKKLDSLATNEIAILQQYDEDRVEIKSKNISIRSATVEGVFGNTLTDAEYDDEIEEPGVTYTVQVLARSSDDKPHYTYFTGLDSPSEVVAIKGKDGMLRYVTGEYTSKREATKYMRTLKRRGYRDAFVRKTTDYESL